MIRLPPESPHFPSPTPYRSFYKRRFRKRRGRQKKLVLTQWTPQTIRACPIRGTVCLVMCGHTKASRTYALHSEDFVPQLNAIGGTFSTTAWSLKALYAEHQKLHNRWTHPTNHLDLARNRGCGCNI